VSKTQTTAIMSPKSNRIAFYMLYAVYWLNELVVRSSRIRGVLTPLLISELFYIDGSCQSSGNCCKHIMIFDKGQPVESIDRWVQKQSKSAQLERFEPVIKDQKIHHYNCSCLNSENRCAKYDSRPNFCRSYPIGHFLAHLSLEKGCGYHISQKEFQPSIKQPRFNQVVQTIQKELALS
jgi:Fe-S-cluster containining protein